MEFIQGTVTHCQLAAGFGTGYITLFRVDGRPVELRTPRPFSLADGDQIIAAGPRRGHAVQVLACHNVTTSETARAEFWAHALAAVFGVGVAVAVDGISVVARSYTWLFLTPLPLLIALLCARRAWLIRRAARTVAMAVAHGTVRRL